MFAKERGRPNLLINCYFLRERNVHIYITILSQLKYWKYRFQAKMRIKIANISWNCDSPRPPNCTKLVCQRLSLLGFFPICNIFPIIDSYSFFFWNRSWYSDECAWRSHLIFVLYKNKGFNLVFNLVYIFRNK